jgi:ribosomal protein S18 acetylase RimI-like enzyme
MAAVGELRVAVYTEGGFMSPTSGYAPRLRGLGAGGAGTVLVAVDDAGGIVGTIMIQSSPHAGQVVKGADEAEIRALAVAPGVQGRGLGWALLQAALARAWEEGKRHVVLSTQVDMVAAHRLYERAGFRRLPERDWSPEPGTPLLAYGLRLDERYGRLSATG